MTSGIPLPNYWMHDDPRYKHLTRRQRRYILYRNQGKCYYCGAEALPGHAGCANCLAEKRAYMQKRRKERKEQGLCTKCGHPIEDNSGSTVHGKGQCPHEQRR